MGTAAEDDAFYGADIVVVAAARDEDVTVARDLVVGGVDVDPADVTAKYRHPRMGRIGTDEPRATRWRHRGQIAADVLRGQTQRAQTGDFKVGEILADAAPVLEHFPYGRGDRRGTRVVNEVAVDAPREVERGFQNRAARRERTGRVVGEFASLIGGTRVERELIGVQPVARKIATQAVADLFPCGCRLIRTVRRGADRDEVVRRHFQFAVRFLHREVRRDVAEIIEPIHGDRRFRIDANLRRFARLPVVVARS